MGAAPALERRMVIWTPALTATLISIVGSVIVGLAALGQWCTVYTKNWKNACESSQAMVATLQAQLDEAGKERRELEDRLHAAEQKHSDDTKLMEARMAAWEAQLAQAQRLNHLLQQRLDAAETRHAAIDARNEERNERNEERNIEQHPRKK